MKLHHYQKRCLDELAEFLAESEERGVKSAFRAACGRNYVPAHKMPKDMPYICIRVPTGGGKTLMGAHAVGVVAAHLHREFPVCLWLAPSEVIVQQTLKSLQNREHPCYHALTEKFSNVNCIGIKEALSIKKADIDDSTTIIVATIQTFRVEDKGDRKAYEDNDGLMSHGEGAYSLAGVLKKYSPIIISDEAHNASTKLSYESLSRFDPACLVEFTATPQVNENEKKRQYPSNVLCQASARELKAASMIKMPLNLETRADWRENIRAALQKREELEKTADKLKEHEYIRPIILYQATSAGDFANVQEIRNTLLKEGVHQNHIAIYTSDIKELKNANLFSEKCPIRHIITVRALAEGWDCSFAYVLCTMANLVSEKSVEQVLGRILRMPGAVEKTEASLNECYAFATSNSFYETATTMADALVIGAGFDKLEARDLVRKYEGNGGTDGLFYSSASEENASCDLPSNMAPFKVPMMAVREDEQLVLLEENHLLDINWSIARETPDMSSFRLPDTGGERGKISVNESGRTQISSIETFREQYMFMEADKQWEEVSLAAWLNLQTSSRDISLKQSAPYVLEAVRMLSKIHDMEKLGRYRFYVKKAIIRAIDNLRRKKRTERFQLMLQSHKVGDDELEVNPECALTFDERHYASSSYCKDAGMFRRHLFPLVGDLKKSGEEWKCACFIDRLPEVEVWVRNLERQPNSFWLQTSTDKFYPDFVCRLKKDKRILVVEYKGADRWSNDDSKEKRALGEMWEKLSGKKCLFVMPNGIDDLSAIKKRIEDG